MSDKPIKLWYVHLTPKKVRDEADMERILWVSLAMAGIEDHREEKWATRYQKPLAFTNRRDAVIEAEKHENEYWHASARELRVIF